MMNWREYHDSTKHTVESLRREGRVLDWANMPNTFRHYEGVPVVDLPANTPVPEVPALDVLGGAFGSTPAEDGATLVSQLLFYSAAISASKLVPSSGYRYALRVNPSSGNLHPTEFHFLTRGLTDWPDGIYHYRPSSHMAEQRAVFHPEAKPDDAGPRMVVMLTSISWREAWKYRDRGYRYCLHDIGHAWEAVTLAARAIGYDTVAAGEFGDEEVARYFRLHHDEWPMLLIHLRGNRLPAPEVPPASIQTSEEDTQQTTWYGGEANQLSNEIVPYPRIDAIHQLTKVQQPACGSVRPGEGRHAGSGEIKLPAPATSRRSFGEVARTRRSALDFTGGHRSMSLPQLSAVLGSATQPLTADFGGCRFIQLYVYVHRVSDLEPGVYRHWPERNELERVRRGDQRVAAAGLSLGQDLAGNACVAFSMIGDLDRATRIHGDRGYRYVHFEAGAIGQRLYVAAHALGLGATGIGAFYDEEVHRYLKMPPQQGQVVYHFAIGYPVPDPRIEA